MKTQVKCPRCGTIWQQGIDLFSVPEPMPGCRPGRIWVHYRPSQGRRKRVVCVYGDGEHDPRLSPTAAVALAVPDDAPPVVLAQAGERRAA